MVKPGATNVVLGTMNDPAQSAPELAKLAAQVASDSSLLETYVSGIFVAMLGATEADNAIAIYAALKATSTQTVAFDAIASRTLTPEQYRVWSALRRLHKAVAKERNAIVHGVWGNTPDLPGKALIVDPDVFLAYHQDFLKWEMGILGRMSVGLLDIEHQPGVPRDKIMVYEERDFTGPSERIRKLIRLMRTFRAVLHLPWGADLPLIEAHRNGELLQWLSDVPEVREELDRRKPDQRTPPTESPP
jgi:hypothetical protein